MELEFELETSCNETAAINQTNFDCVDLTLRVFHGIILALILAAAVAGNLTVLLLVYKHRELRQRSVLASLGLVIANLLMATVWVFQGEASTIAGEWPFLDEGCAVFAYFYLSLLFVRWGEVFVFTNDRFCQIFFPFFYRRWANLLLVTSTILSWVLAAVVSVPLVAPGFAAYYLSLSACSVNCRDNQTCSNIVIGLFGSFIIIGGVIPTVMYIAAYLYGWKKKREMRNMLEMGTGEGIPRNESRDIRWMSPQETKALRTCFLVFMTNIITNIPLYFTSSVRTQDIYQDIPIWTHFLVTYIFLMAPVMDPLVVMRTKNFRDVLQKTFQFKRKAPANGAISKALFTMVPVLTGMSSDESCKNNVVTTETTLSLSNTVDHTTLDTEEQSKL